MWGRWTISTDRPEDDRPGRSRIQSASRGTAGGGTLEGVADEDGDEPLPRRRADGVSSNMLHAPSWPDRTACDRSAVAGKSMGDSSMIPDRHHGDRTPRHRGYFYRTEYQGCRAFSIRLF